MTATASTPLTDAEISHLEFLLATPAFARQSMGLDEIQGYVCAVISGPEQVTSKQWLPAVLGNPDYENDAQAQEVRALLLRFHDEIAADLKAGESLGLVLELAEPTSTGAESEYDYAAWCQAYLDGVESSSVPWTEAGDEEEINDLLFPISLLAGEIDPKALKQVKPREMTDLLQECREDLPMLAVDIYKYFQSLRNRPKVTAKHPGSVPAPAGSEKKKLH
ncbi:MAG: YecA family protein [Betaproteobacteria bacterium]